MNNKKLLKYLEEKVELKKQDKTELANHKVDLALVDDAKKGLTIVEKAYKNSAWNSLEKLPSYVREIIADAQEVLNEAWKGQQMAIVNARKVSEMAKELGIDTPKEIQEIFKNNDYDELLKAFDDGVNKVISAAKK